MKRFSILIFALVLPLFVFAGSSIRREYKTYGAGTPGEVYFAMITNSYDSLSTVMTNRDVELWFPDRVTVVWDVPILSTNRISVVWNVKNEFYYDSFTNTDELGNIETNWMHQLTNVTYTPITNYLVTWTNALTQTNYTIQFPSEFLCNGDELRFDWGSTNSKWIRIIGRR